MAKDWFTEHKVSFVDYNVAVDQEKKKELFEMTGQMAVPVIKIGNDVIIGFNEAKLASLIEG
jgi:glutaredoxin